VCERHAVSKLSVVRICRENGAPSLSRAP
jgi:hypothetical protein